MAIWPSGKAKVCKTLIPSSNLGVASKMPEMSVILDMSNLLILIGNSMICSCRASLSGGQKYILEGPPVRCRFGHTRDDILGLQNLRIYSSVW